MNKQTEVALKMAIEGYEKANEYRELKHYEVEALHACLEALEQPSQEPIAIPKMDYDDPIWLKIAMDKSYKNRLLEALSDLEHQQWIKWAKSIIDSEPISDTRKQRWLTMMVDYKDLPDNIQEYDREWARKVMALVSNPTSEQVPLSYEKYTYLLDCSRMWSSSPPVLMYLINKHFGIDTGIKEQLNITHHIRGDNDFEESK